MAKVILEPAKKIKEILENIPPGLGKKYTAQLLGALAGYLVEHSSQIPNKERKKLKKLFE